MSLFFQENFNTMIAAESSPYMIKIQRIKTYLSFLYLIISISFLSQLIYSNQITYADNQIDRYWSALTGDKQIPRVNTTAMGYVGLKFQDDLKRFVYIVNANNIGNVTGIYVYKKDNNNNGTVILDLMNSNRKLKDGVIKIVKATPEGKLTGTLSIGGAKKDDFQGQLKGKTVSDFYKLMVNGSLYVNVNTKEYPNGEIRGNSFVPMDDLFPDPSKIRWHNPMTENDGNKTELMVSQACGIECKGEVTQTLNHARDEIKNGNITGALLELNSAQTALNMSKD